VEIAAAGHAVALNLSVRSTDNELLDSMRSELESGGADPGRIVLELSEGQLVSRLGGGKGVGASHRLREAGPAVRERPHSGRAPAPEGAQAAAKAHDTGQRVVAQGVEDLVALQLLQELGVDEAQGYALGRPEPVESALRTLP
jgi:EAL domain-containing protein (putative c-di-GMP-specific phosphodiesterase class I)